MLAYGIPPDFRGGVHLVIYAAIRHRVSPEFIKSRNCVPMAFTTGSPPARASISRSSFSNECCLFRFHHGPISILLFSHTHYWYEVVILIVRACYRIQNTESSGGKMVCIVCMYVSIQWANILYLGVWAYMHCVLLLLIKICACFWFVLKSCRSKSLAFYLVFGDKTRLE